MVVVVVGAVVLDSLAITNVCESTKYETSKWHVVNENHVPSVLDRTIHCFVYVCMCVVTSSSVCSGTDKREKLRLRDCVREGCGKN